jgi:hypothetical protein
MNGLVLDFVRLAVHDGPGIRKRWSPLAKVCAPVGQASAHRPQPTHLLLG